MGAQSVKASFSQPEVLAQLRRTLASDGIRRADGLARFLTYAVEETLAGREAELKEYSIGVSVFQRGADFDGRVDPIVRVQARKLRARIDEYNATAGAQDELIIEFTRGSYAPVFRSQTQVTPAAATRALSLAVLPYRSLGEAAGLEYRSDGLTEELIGELSRMPGLQVAARTSSYAFQGVNVDVREIGARLGVTFLLEGNIRQAGGKLLISSQLIEAASGFHKWSDTAEVALEESFTVPSRVAGSVAAALGLAGAPMERPCSIDAYDAYLKARYHWSRRTEEDVRTAVKLYEQSMAADPSFSQPYSGLADCFVMLAIYGHLPPALIMPRAKQLAARALELNPQSAEAYTTMGMICAVYDWQHDAARDAFLRAIELRPSYPDAHQWYASLHLCTVGRLNEAIQELEAALQYDPLSMTVLGDLGNTLSLAGRHDEGLEACLQVIARDPGSFRVYWQIGLVYERMGRMEEAIRAFEECRSLSAGNPFESAALGSLGHALATAGRTDEARTCLAQLEMLASQRTANPLSFALIYTGLRETDRAFEWFNRAADARIGTTAWMAIDPRGAPLRDDPRFLQLMVRFGLSD
jgi:TolB-like protein/Flp pilus assembly protein TadD